MMLIKKDRASLEEALRLAENADKRQFIDTKISALEGILITKKRQYEEYLERKREVAKEMDRRTSIKPIDFSDIHQTPRLSVADDEVLPQRKGSISEYEQLVPRRRAIPQAKPVQDDAPFRQEHDELASDLVIMARNLKKNNLALQGLLGKDKQVLHEADTLLATNQAKFKREHETLQTFRTKSWRSTKTIILLLFALFFAFIVMYVFIKFT